MRFEEYTQLQQAKEKIDELSSLGYYVTWWKTVYENGYVVAWIPRGNSR
ncbi:MAG: hypothetical protein IJX23_01340 [Clostridia bacterium]|nr:hypothetical protein [Clostridia bacterium]